MYFQQPLAYSLCLSISLLFAEPVPAQTFDQQPGSSRKSIEIVRTDLVPDIDGALDDEIWKSATVINDMHQFQPVDHGEPSESSVFYLAYSERFLYIGARLYDSDPAAISARQLVQGQTMRFDDAFEFLLDTFNNGRTGYSFQVNPNGIRVEGVYDDPSRLNRDWTGIWQVESRIDEEGWTSEVAIPFNTLNFDPTAEAWGFTIARTIARKNEELAWSSFNRNINPTTTGLLTGIRDIRQGVGLDIIPSLALAGARDEVAGVSDNRTDPSLNVFYKITPNLTGALTINTDFSATEVDNRQVNLSRFSLFFPEKRDFFLQDVDIFNFGGRGSGTNNRNNNGIPFYSRRIGLGSNGQPVDIDAGLKVTGRIGNLNMGALAVQQGENGTLDAQNLFVGRVAANVLGESSIGAIFTDGNPASEISNSLAGVDFRYQNTRFSDTHTLSIDNYYQQTSTDGLNGDSKSFGTNTQWRTQGNGLGGSLGYNYVGEDFNPALGFANQRGVDSYYLGGTWRRFFRNNPRFRFWTIRGRYEYTRRLDNREMQSGFFFLRPFTIETHRGDSFSFGPTRNREGLQRDFEISPGIVIPKGKYTFDSYSIELQASNQRVFAPSLTLTKGDFYTGTTNEANVGLEWRPDEHFYLRWSYNYQDIQLPQGDFKVKLVSANANYAFNSKWSWVNLIQYDNASSSAGINSRLRWNPQAGEDLFIVLNYNFDSEGVFSKLSAEKSEIALKYTRTFRF